MSDVLFRIDIYIYIHMHLSFCLFWYEAALLFFLFWRRLLNTSRLNTYTQTHIKYIQKWLWTSENKVKNTTWFNRKSSVISTFVFFFSEVFTTVVAHRISIHFIYILFRITGICVCKHRIDFVYVWNFFSALYFNRRHCLFLNLLIISIPFGYGTLLK